MEESKKYDVVIIGGGPAGLTAAIYCARRAMKTLVLTRDIGGQITKTDKIENYPGLEAISGADLAMKFFNQAKSFGTEIVFDEAKKINPVDGGFQIDTLAGRIETRSVILAFGKKPRELDVPGEEQFKGAGVSYCATCDAPFYKDKTLAIVGGGNSALEATVYSAKIATKVYLIYRGTELRGENIMQEEIKKLSNVEVLYNEEIAEIKGTQSVEELVLKSGKSLATNGIIVEIGYVIDRTLAQGLVEMDEKNQIIIDAAQQTSHEGIFAAGDLTTTPAKQIVIAAGEGAKAALACYDYLQKQEGKRGILADWH